MRIYAIGPVTGIEGHNRAAFEAARDTLHAAGFTALIPHDFVPSDASWQQAMRRSIETLVKAEGVAYLPGWSSSNGARLEALIASELGIPVMAVNMWADKRVAESTLDVATKSKHCPHCGRTLPLLLFAKSATSEDGRQRFCTKCTGLYQPKQSALDNANEPA